MGLRISNATATFVGTNAAVAEVRFGTVSLHALSGDRDSRTFANLVSAHAIGRLLPINTDPGANGVHVATATVHILATRTQLFHWNEMLYYEVFPRDIGYNSVGATRYNTDVIVVDSGVDQRLSRWDQPLMEYDVAYGVRTIEQLQRLNIFFRTMRGRKFSFLFYDPLDHTSGELHEIDYTEDFPADPTDQFIADGDHNKKAFQLIKTYHSPGGYLTSVRPITKPIEGTVKVAINGTEVFNWTVDRMTGIVTFTPRVELTGLTAMAINPILVSGNPTNYFTVVSPNGVFTDIQVGDKIVMSGWAISTNNTTEAMRLTVTAKSLDNKTLTINSDTATWLTEAGRNGVTIYTHPAPKVGEVVTAGYSFYVPVRFDTDRLPISLDDYGTGAAAEVKVIEVRPYDL